MNEAEWIIRKKRIDTKLRALNPAWKIVLFREGLDFLSLTCHAVDNFLIVHKLTPEQLQWLSLVREHLVKNLSMDEGYFDLTPLLEMWGGKAKARKVFGDLTRVVAELNEVVAR